MTTPAIQKAMDQLELAVKNSAKAWSVDTKEQADSDLVKTRAALLTAIEQDKTEAVGQLREVLTTVTDALFIYDGQVSNPDDPNGWSEQEGFLAYQQGMTAITKVREAYEVINEGDETTIAKERNAYEVIIAEDEA